MPPSMRFPFQKKYIWGLVLGLIFPYPKAIYLISPRCHFHGSRCSQFGVPFITSYAQAMLILTYSPNDYVIVTGHSGLITCSHPGQHPLFLHEMHIQSNTLLTPDVLNSWLLIPRLRALSPAFRIGKISEIRGKREVGKVSSGHRNPFEYLHVNGKDAELGEGQKWMNIGSRGSD